MANATITGTASNFGSISGVLAGEAGTVAGTITGTVSGTLTGSVGVPGAGVPSGGTTGQVLKKVSNTDYDTTWGTDLASAAWGTITGTLSSQTDLQTALNLKADLASPALTGNPTAPTAATGDNDTTIATTAFVQQELAAGTAVAKNLEVYVRNQSGATLTAGTIVYIDGATGNRPTVTKAQANNDANSAQTFGFIKENIANNGFGYVIVRGELENVDTSALTEGQQLYLSPTTAGTWTTTKPSAPQHLVYVGIVVRAHPTQGIILVAIQNGYELDEIHDVKITTPSNGQVLKYDSAQGLWVNGTDSSGVAWGGITGTLSAQTDLQNALDAKATAADFLSKAGNLSGLANLATSRTNLGLGTMATETASNYLTTSAASSTYLTQANAATTYALKTNGELKGNFTLDGTTASPNSDGSILIGSLSSGYSYLYLAAGDIKGRTFSGTNSSFTLDATSGLQLFSSGQGVRFPDASVQTVAYPGPSGFLLKADNLSGLANTGTARTNLGLGTMATETASNYLTTATASSTYAPLVSPALTNTPTAPTASAGTNTTQIATTAFVQQEVPAASTTAAGKVELATVAEALKPSSSTLGMTPETTREMLLYPGYIQLYGGGNASVSGAGAASTFTFASQRYHAMRSPNASTAGFGAYIFDYTFNGIGMAAMTRGSSSLARKWNSRIWVSGRTVLGEYAETTSGLDGNVNCTARVMLGGRANAATGGMLNTENGIGWKVAGGGSQALVLTVSNGTTLTEVTSSFTPVLKEVFDWKIYSDGAGNVTLWVNDSQAATTTGGPTTSTAELYNCYLEIIEQTASSTGPFGMSNFGSKVFWSQP